MGRLVSLLIVMIGFIGGFFWLPTGSAQRQLVDIADIATRPSDGSLVVSPRTSRSFSPDQPLYVVREAARPSQIAAQEQKPSAPSPKQVSRPTNDGWRTTIAGIGSGAGAGPTVVSEVALARKIQAGLRSAGCYWGDVDGDWGPASRRAMAQYMKAVNASLPLDRPDEILLRLVQRTAVEGCSPPTIVAGRKAPAALPQVAVNVERSPAWPASGHRPEPLPGRMSIGAPVVEEAPLVRAPELAQRPGQPMGPLPKMSDEAAPSPSPDRSTSDEVIIYPAGQALAYQPRDVRRAPPRRQAARRKPRDIFQTSWARQAFGGR